MMNARWMDEQMGALKKRHALVILTLLLAACSDLPMMEKPSQPLTARPPIPVAHVPNGSIYQMSQRGLFEDPRAHQVGDTLIVLITERTNASKQSSSDASRSSDISFNVSSYLGLPGKTLMPDLGAKTGNDFAGKGDSAANNVFNGTIAVTVLETLPNGNLVVGGQKEITINQGTETIRFTGVVNPTNIMGNTVSSTMVADAKIDYVGKGYINEAQRMGWLSRFFMSISPF